MKLEYCFHGAICLMTHHFLLLLLFIIRKLERKGDRGAVFVMTDYLLEGHKPRRGGVGVYKF